MGWGGGHSTYSLNCVYFDPSLLHHLKLIGQDANSYPGHVSLTWGVVAVGSCQYNVKTGVCVEPKEQLLDPKATFLWKLRAKDPKLGCCPSSTHTQRPTSRRYARLRSIPAAAGAARRGSRSCRLAKRFVVLWAAVPVVKVAASWYVGWRRDPVLLQLRRSWGASYRKAASVQRIVAAAVAEPVEAVRPPGGHLRVGGRTGDRKEKSETRSGSTATWNHQTRIYCPCFGEWTKSDACFKKGTLVSCRFDPLQNIYLSSTNPEVKDERLNVRVQSLGATYCHLVVGKIYPPPKKNTVSIFC